MSRRVDRHQFVAAHPAPRSDVRPRGWIVGQHLEQLTGLDLIYPLSKLHDRDRASRPEAVQGQYGVVPGIGSGAGG